MFSPTAHNTRVLIIDDDEDDLFFSRRLVEKAAPESVIATIQGSAAAMNYLVAASNPTERSERIPALILLDVNMPAPDGFEVLRWIRRNHLFARTKVVMLSNSEEIEDVKRATELGAHGFLIKHPHPNVMACVLHHAFETDHDSLARKSDESQLAPGDEAAFSLPPRFE